MTRCPKCGHKWSETFSIEVREGMLDDEIQGALVHLWDLRKAKKYQEADVIRQRFKELGFILEYGKDFISYRRQGQRAWEVNGVSFECKKGEGKNGRTGQRNQTGQATGSCNQQK